MRDELPREIRGLVTLLYTTGWRLGEALSLKWGRVDRRAQEIRLPGGSTKNKKPRSVPYGALPELVEVIERQWSERERLGRKGKLSPWVFSRDGEPIRTFRETWDSACGRAGVPGVLIHDMRRSAVRNFVRAGVPEKTAMEITGHVTRSVFDRYNIVDETDKAAALGRLAIAGEEHDEQGGWAEQIKR